MKKYLLYFCLLLLIIACNNKKDIPAPLFELMENTGVNFTNTVVDDSLENGFLFRNFYNGSGVATGDINNDGLPDIFLTSNSDANKLYLNKGDFTFEDISDKAGIIKDEKWNTGVVFADINADGWLDIYVCTSGHMGTGTRKNKLYINNHNLTFTESATKYKLDISAYTTQVSFFDFDLDGDLDCFMINNSPIPINQLNYANRRDLPDSLWKIPDFLKGGGDHLFRNDNGVYNEITSQAGIHGGLISFGLGVSVSDINGDGWPDVFVSNDSYERDYLYINQKNGTFKDEMEEWFQHTSFSSMGADVADINNDGYPDLFTTDMLPMNEYRLKTTGSFDNISLFNTKFKSGFYYQYTKNCLQLNNRNGKFIDIARYSGVAATDWSWGALIFDMDNDGWNDLYVCNGVAKDVTDLDFMDFFANVAIQKMVLTGRKAAVDEVLKEIPVNPLPNKVYQNNKDLTFTDIGEAWGLGQPTFSNGAAYADFDNDGDFDLIICNTNQPTFIYKNKSREINHFNFISFTLKGKDKNPFAFGSKIQLFAGSQIFTRELVPSRGFQSSVDLKLLFGLGSITVIDSAVISWPDRTVSVFKKPTLNTNHTIQQKNSNPAILNQPSQSLTVFTEVPANFDKHVENEYVDFYNERLVPRVFSREGPKAAVADVNGDGLDDIYIGGAEGTIGKLYIQKVSGQFENKVENSFKQFADFEDVAVTFLDYDKDNDADLLVCPGGNNHSLNSRELQFRMFDNDGKGNFKINTSVFPNTGMNIAVVAVNDFNNDGYPDLFAGARSYPGYYGKTPHSYIFVNDRNGHFTELPENLSSGLENAGMITSAQWADVTGDTQKELVITGEWMTPRIFSFSKNRFEEIKTNLNELYGWWQTLSISDINNDGKQDLVLGNIGENFYLNPAINGPVKLWMNDFDNNGDLDKIITYSVDGKDLPVFLKRDIQDQLPSLKKENLKHSDYAGKSIQNLFSKELVTASQVKQFNYASSCVAINNGNGNFKVNKLPVMCQLSCINSVQPFDINQDGSIDLVTGGNQFGLLPQFEKLDASLGDVLINDGKGNFTWVEAKKTGLNLRGELRDIAIINNNKKIYFLFLQNNETPVMFQLNKQLTNYLITQNKQ